jgi:DNA-binding beta-propeller fold protein YncE
MMLRPNDAPRRGRITALAVLVVSLLITPALMPSAQAAWVQPSFERSIGGIGRPGAFAWGLSFNPVTREVILGDYLNFKVRRFVDGVHVGDLPDRPGEVWATGVDRNTGDIYYSSNWDDSIERFDKNGNYLSTLRLSGGWNAWFDVDPAGDLWVVDGSPQSTSYSLMRYRKDGTRLNSWTLPNSFPKKMTIFGVGVANDGTVYLPDSNNRQIQVYKFNAATGSLTFQRTFGNGIVGTDLRGIAIDETNRFVYTSDSSYNNVRKFMFDGTYVGAIGAGGSAPGKFFAPRQLDVDPATGDLYVADYGNWRYQRFSSSGAFIAAYPNPAQPAPAGHLAHAADAVVDPTTGNVWVADTYNQRFQRFAPDGTLTGTWGQRGGSADPYGQNYPSTIGFDPVNHRVWIGQEEGRVIKVYTDQGVYVTTIAKGPKTPENQGYTKNVTDIDFFNGKAYVSDEQYDKIKVIDAATFTELSEIDVYNGSGWSGAHGLAIDPTNGNLFVATYSEDKIKVYAPSGSLLYTFGSSGAGDGQFSSPRDVAIIGDTVYVTDADQSRIQAFTKSGQYLGRWGGLGSEPYEFRNPMGLDALGGRLYVSDVENGRITVFDATTPRPAFVYAKPSVTIADPLDGRTLTVSGPLTIRGAAASAEFIANVEIAIQRRGDGLWWDGRNASWESTSTPNIAPWVSSSAPASNVSYTYVFPGAAYGQTYRLEVTAKNRQGTPSDVAVSTVTISPPLAPDTTAPDAIVTAPAKNAIFPRGSVTMMGTATDDRGVSTVQIAVKDTVTAKWLRADGTFGAFTWLPAVLSSPGATSTAWSAIVSLPAGSYALNVRTIDAASNEDPTKPWIAFVVS